MHEENREVESKMVNTQESSVPSSAQEGVPSLRRDPRVWVRKIVGMTQRPKVRVWLMPIGRGFGVLGILSSVAFLGAQSKETDHYGQPLDLGTRPPSLVEPGAKPVEVEKPPEPVLAQSASQKSNPCVATEKPSRSAGLTKDGRIVLNEATKEELTKLPGVGDSRAEAILQLRKRLGKFRKVSDLLRVRGIGWKTLQSMKAQLVVDRPQEEEKNDAEESEKAPKQVSQAKQKDLRNERPPS